MSVALNKPRKAYKRCPSCEAVLLAKAFIRPKRSIRAKNSYDSKCQFCMSELAAAEKADREKQSSSLAGSVRERLARARASAEEEALRAALKDTGDSAHPWVQEMQEERGRGKDNDDNAEVVSVDVSTGFAPHHIQREVLDSPARFKVIATGVRFGKTKIGIYYMARAALAKANGMFWVVAPTYKMLATAEREWRELFAEMSQLYVYNVKDHRYTLKSGSIVEFVSGEWPDQLRGPGLDGILIDEAAYLKVAASRILRTRVSDTLGWIVAVSSCKGKNWFHNWFIRGKSNEYRDYQSFRARSCDNPHFPPDEWEEAKKELPEDFFRQEYEAEFLDEQAGVFRRIDGIISKDSTIPIIGHGPFNIGLDLAKTRDFTVITVMDSMGRVMDWHRMNSLSWVDQKREVLRFAKKWNATIYMDSTGVGDPIHDELTEKLGEERVIGIKFGLETKRQLVQGLQSAIEQRHILIPNEEVLIDELKWFEYKRTAAGNLRYQAPSGFHDDCVYSLALANWARLQKAAIEPPVMIDVAPSHDREDRIEAASRLGLDVGGRMFGRGRAWSN